MKKQTIDEFLKGVDNWINIERGGSVYKLGLTMHFSTTDNNWHVYYGRDAKIKYHKIAPSLIEALSLKLKELEDKNSTTK